MAKRESRPVTDEEKEMIIDLYFDKGMTQPAIAQKIGRSQSTVNTILNNPELLERKLHRLRAYRLRAQIKVDMNQEKAVDKQVELMQRDFDEAYMYLSQNAARDILDRGGTRAQKDGANEINITFGAGPGFAVGMPDHSEDDARDSAEDGA